MSIGIVQKGYVFDGNLEFFNSLLMLQNGLGKTRGVRPGPEFYATGRLIPNPSIAA